MISAQSSSQSDVVAKLVENCTLTVWDPAPIVSVRRAIACPSQELSVSMPPSVLSKLKLLPEAGKAWFPSTRTRTRQEPVPPEQADSAVNQMYSLAVSPFGTVITCAEFGRSTKLVELVFAAVVELWETTWATYPGAATPGGPAGPTGPAGPAGPGRPAGPWGI